MELKEKNIRQITLTFLGQPPAHCCTQCSNAGLKFAPEESMALNLRRSANVTGPIVKSYRY